MEERNRIKRKRQKKRKSRTQVSSGSDSDSDRGTQLRSQSDGNHVNAAQRRPVDVPAAFVKYYQQRAAIELTDDLDVIRNTDDFKEDALLLLVNALQQGAGLFTVEEQRRVVIAGMAKTEEKKPAVE